MKKSSYVFGAAAVGSLVSAINQQANAATIANFTFETSGAALTVAAVTGQTFSFTAESGTGTGIASHAATGTVYSSPAGSGSLRSLSANNYVAGDYFQFGVTGAAATGLGIAFDAVSSSTGPKVFNLQYSSDGVSFSNFTSYTLNSGTTTAFATSATNSAVNYSFDLSGITALNNAAVDAFRLVESDTTTATGGTSRVDNVFITGTTTPEPATLGLAVAAIGGLAMRRRDA